MNIKDKEYLQLLKQTNMKSEKKQVQKEKSTEVLLNEFFVE